MKKIYLIIVALVTLIVLISGCIKQIQQNPKANNTGWTQEGINNIVDSNNQFAFELYSELNNNQSNVFFSPYSIYSALAMAYEGARGETAQEMKSVFHFPDKSILRPNFAEIYNQMNTQNKNYELHTANALWAQQSYPFSNNYFNVIKDYYAGKATNLDFIKETEKSRQTINNWVEQQTNNKIKDLIKPGQLNDMTRLIITNAVYFKGKWVYQFDKKDTKEMDFRTLNETIKVPMMYLNSKAEFNYTETDDIQVLELPYTGNKISMFIFLPKNNISSLEKELNIEKIKEYEGMLKEQKVVIYLPKFKFKTRYVLNDQLIKMGMPTAFLADKADFSGMTGRRDLFISFVIHQAFVDVDEEGTEAAAATAVGMAATAVRQENIFKADHPFIFIIQDKTTGNILFLGKVVNPID